MHVIEVAQLFFRIVHFAFEPVLHGLLWGKGLTIAIVFKVLES